MASNICRECDAPLNDAWNEKRARCPFCGAETGPAGIDDSMGAMTVQLPPLPAGSSIEVLESTPERRVFLLPRNPKAGHGILGFGVVLALMGGAMLILPNLGKGKPETAGIVIGTLLAAAGGFAVHWAGRASNTIHRVAVEPSRLVVDREVYGKHRRDEFDFGPEVQAKLVVAYEVNYVPVYTISIGENRRSTRFGLALPTIEQNWLADRINEMLNPMKADAGRTYARV